VVVDVDVVVDLDGDGDGDVNVHEARPVAVNAAVDGDVNVLPFARPVSRHTRSAMRPTRNLGVPSRTVGF
jgi:hypothetical protein